MKLDKEKLLKFYVKYSIKFVNLNVNMLNGYMKHLIIVQGLDPNAEPGSSFRKILSRAVDTGIANKAYEEDFDLSWVRKKYFDVKDRLKKTDLNLKDFKKMTDISKLNDTPIEPKEVTTTQQEILDKIFDKVPVQYESKDSIIRDILRKELRENSNTPLSILLNNADLK